MKTINAIISVLLAFVAGYIFFTAKSDKDLILFGFALLTSILFLMFYMYEEQKQEVERLRQIIIKNKINRS